jgi:hypothetical protein
MAGAETEKIGRDPQVWLAVAILVVLLVLLAAFGLAVSSIEILPSGSSGPPSFELESITVRARSATVSGRINGMDMTTEAYVRYGPSARYGSCSRVAQVADNADGSRVRFALVGLRPRTTYHYLFVVLGGHGQVYDSSRDLTFTTRKPGVERKLDLGGVADARPGGEYSPWRCV